MGSGLLHGCTMCLVTPNHAVIISYINGAIILKKCESSHAPKVQAVLFFFSSILTGHRCISLAPEMDCPLVMDRWCNSAMLCL